MKTMLVVFDTECTGAEDNDRIVQLSSVIHLEGDADAMAFDELCNPGIPIPKEATEIHGITDAMVANCRQPGDVVAEWWQDLVSVAVTLPEGSQVLFAGHNVSFDIRKVAPFRAAFPIKNVLDTLLVARRQFPHAANHTLSNIHSSYVRRPSANAKDAHNALSDCWMVHDIIQQVCQDKGMSWWDLYVSTLTPVKIDVMPYGKHKGKPFSELPTGYLEYMIDKDIDIDTKYSMQLEVETREPTLIETMPFGKHKGVAMKDLPEGYVVWMSENMTLGKDMIYTLKEYFPGVFAHA